MTQPKNMEQLKKEAREELNNIIPVEGEIQELDKGVDDIATVFMGASMQTQRVPLEVLIESYITQAHCSGRESMRDECVDIIDEEMKKEHATATKDEFHSGRFWGVKDLQQTIATALKEKL